MYAEFFGLAELPFRITPDPRFLWYSEQHQEARDRILCHITQSAGPIYLLAEVGTGKTTLARRIAEELQTDRSKRVVFVFAPRLTTTNAFLRFVMDEFEVKTDRSYGGGLKNFENFLVEQHEKGISPVQRLKTTDNSGRQPVTRELEKTALLANIQVFAHNKQPQRSGVCPHPNLYCLGTS